MSLGDRRRAGQPAGTVHHRKPAARISAVLAVTVLFSVCLCLGIGAACATDFAPPPVASPRGQGLVLHGDATAVYSLEGAFSLLEDPAGALTLREVIAAEAGGRVQALPSFLSLGFTRDVVWLHARIESAAPQRMDWVLELHPAFVDHIDLYSGRPGQEAEDYTLSRFGDLEPLSGRRLRTAQSAAQLTLDPGEVRDLYIRISTTSAMILRGSISGVTAASEARTREDFLMGMVYGTFVLIFLMNLMTFLWLRESWQILYAGYVALSGVAYLSLSGYMPFLAGDHAVGFINLSYGVSIFLASLFSGLFWNAYLQLKQQMRWLYRLTVWLSWLYGGAALGAAVGYYSALAPFLLPVMVLHAYLSVGVGVVLYRRGFRPAGVFSMAFLPLPVFGLISVARLLGWLDPSFLTENATQIGMCVHMVMMTFGLAMRVGDAEAERAQAQSDLALMARSSEQRAIRLVEERTRELALAKEQLEDSLQAERQAIADQIRFIDMISHEYRTPVSVLNSSLDTLTVRLSAPGTEGGRILDRMRRAVRRLTEVIEVGLQQQRMDGHVLRLYPVLTDIQLIVSDVVLGLQAQNPGRIIRLTNLPPTDGGPVLVAQVLADEEMMETLFRNLIGNALKYSPAETVVDVRLAQDGPALVVEVEDQGRGIPDQDLPRVFEKYTRGSNTQGVAGTGFGLYMARKLVNLHGGSIRIFSRAGAGTTVRVSLPIPQGGMSGGEPGGA